MSLFDRIKADKDAVATSVLLMGALLAKLLQAAILHLMTDLYPFSTETLINTGMGLMPAVMLLVYVLVYYKTEKSQILLPCIFVFQFAVTALYAWEDYQIAGGHLNGDWVFSNLIWLVYYAFLIYVTYKGFENIVLIRVFMGIVIAYSAISSGVSLVTLVRVFPEERVAIASQMIAVVGNLCYYVATLLIVPKAVKEKI